MLLKKGKKLNFILYIVLILILTSVNNYNYNYKNIFIIKNIQVNGFSAEKNKFIKEDIQAIFDKNIIFLGKKNFKKLIDRNDTKELIVKKIYPNKLLISFIPAKPISIIENQNNKIVLGDNGKILDIEINENNFPVVRGSENISYIFEVVNLLISSKFDYNNIKNIIFFKSGRFDIKLKNQLLIRFPINYSMEIINYGSDLLNNKKFVNSKTIDLRINNRIIKYE
tara:strand:- start:12080 stop:12754 length:675 start_codon:yes stop_codon:yes gene_type:complete